MFEAYFSQFDKDLFDGGMENVLPAYPRSPEISPAQMEKVVNFLNTFSERPYDGLDIDRAYTNELIQN